MKLFSGISKFFGRVFVSPENAQKSLDMIRDGLDAVILTPEEKVQYTQKGVEMFLTFVQMAHSGPNLARRFIAILISIIWALAISAVFALAIIGIWYEAAATGATLLFDITLKLILPSWGAVMVFYFGKGMLETVKS